MKFVDFPFDELSLLCSSGSTPIDLDRLAQSRATVLLTGERGVGKELLAHYLHIRSPRSTKPFISINCSGKTDIFLENELFGQEKYYVKGKIEESHGGTLFIAEVGELPKILQSRLFRIMNEMEFERIGGTKTYKIDVPFIASTSKDLKSEVEAGRFRDDLFYRLNVINVSIPPLRKNRDMIPLLINYFIKTYSKYHQKERIIISPEVKEILMKYDWPGNIFELENIIERAVMLCQNNCITLNDISIASESSSSSSSVKIDNLVDIDILKNLKITLPEMIEHIEEAMIRSALEKSNQMQVRAAEMLGISKSLMQYKMKKYNIPSRFELNYKPFVSENN